MPSPLWSDSWQAQKETHASRHLFARCRPDGRCGATAQQLPLRDLWSYIERKQEQDAHLVATSREAARLSERQRDVLARTAEDVGAHFTIESLRALNDVSYATARNDLMELAAQGYLEMTKQGRKFVWPAVLSVMHFAG